ncbi:MAG TPA: serine/threonine-protein kinase [Polyangiaceae bacterium]|jgi:hypothetical protein
MDESLRGGRYVILRPLGEGAQGRTFDGVDKREGRPVAIKRFDVVRAKAWKDVELAEREAHVLRSLSHPKLPAYVDHFEEGGVLYLVMEKIDGESLAALKKRGELGHVDVARFLRDAAEVLAYLHGRTPQVIHRDIKPGNVIRRPDGSFAFVDFGAVRDRLRPEGGSTVVGTFGFMAPEQFQGRALPASDVYAVGATAVCLLTGCEPEALPHKGLAIDVRRALRGRAPAGMIDALERMLDPDPDQRAPSVAPLLSRLEDTRERASREPPRRAPPRYDPGEGVAPRGYRRERWEERRAAYFARRAAFEARRPRAPLQPPWSGLAQIGVALAILAVTLATQLVAPLVLTLLAGFFARRAFTEAAAEVREEGRLAIDFLRTQQARLARRGEDDEEPKVRVAEPAKARVASSPRVRVAEGEEHPIEPEESEPRSRPARGAR